MKVIFTKEGWDFGWAIPELTTSWRGLVACLVKETFSHCLDIDSDKTLVVVRHYYWRGDEDILRYLSDDNFVVVSPFPLKGLKGSGLGIYALNLLPPHKTPGIFGEANTVMEFVWGWCSLIDLAVEEATLPEAIQI